MLIGSYGLTGHESCPGDGTCNYPFGECDSNTGQCYCSGYYNGTTCTECSREDALKCADGSTCILEKDRCNAVVDCLNDQSDEMNCTEGVVTSPLYPNYYPNDLDWKVIIEPVNADFISIIFTDLQIENNYDYVYVFDGDSTDSTLLATFTGSPALPIQIVSSGKKVMIHMTSDDSVQDVGFSLNYTGMKGSENHFSQINLGIYSII